MKLIRDDKGSAIVEMAVIMPVFTALLVGVLSLGYAAQTGITFIDSVRAGAEFALTPGNAANTAQMQTVAAASAANVPNYIVTASNFCSCSPGSGAVSCSSSCPGYGQPAFYAQVTATASLPMLFGGLASLPVSYTTWVRISCQTC